MRTISILIAVSSIGFASDTSFPRSHAEVLQEVIQRIISTAVVDDMKISSTTLILTEDSSGSTQLLRSLLLQKLLGHNNKVYTAPAQCDTILSYNTRQVTLTYGEPFAESFFVSRQVERSIVVSIDFTLRSASSGEIFFARQYSGFKRDTVYLSVIDELNEPAMPFTAVHQYPPSFFDSILEPAIITVASAVAIYLFFTIRS